MRYIFRLAAGILLSLGSGRAQEAGAPPGPASASAAASAPALTPKAQEVAHEAALTPIVPSPRDPLKPAFQLYTEIDIPVLALSVVFSSARFIRTQRAYCGSTGAPKCDPAEINGFDRTTAGYWNPSWANVSDIGALTLGIGAVTLLVTDEGVLPALNDVVVIAQAAMIATAAPSMLTIAAGRPRPFLYGEKAPDDVRNSPDASMSFISSHTSISFAIATATYMTMKRRHPNGPGAWVVLGGGLALASTVGAARVMAGRHFMTDAILGAIVGSAMGVMIPALHESPVKVVPQIDKEKRGAMILIEGWL